jgi:hypothetical protein
VAPTRYQGAPYRSLAMCTDSREPVSVTEFP